MARQALADEKKHLAHEKGIALGMAERESSVFDVYDEYDEETHAFVHHDHRGEHGGEDRYCTAADMARVKEEVGRLRRELAHLKGQVPPGEDEENVERIINNLALGGANPTQMTEEERRAEEQAEKHPFMTALGVIESDIFMMLS